MHLKYMLNKRKAKMINEPIIVFSIHVINMKKEQLQRLAIYEVQIKNDQSISLMNTYVWSLN